MTVCRRHFNDYMQVSLALAREALRKSYDALSLPVPDTFAGRKTQEPFPRNDDNSREHAHMERWLASKELQPPE
jgi:hypothetical protein